MPPSPPLPWRSVLATISDGSDGYPAHISRSIPGNPRSNFSLWTKTTSTHSLVGQIKAANVAAMALAVAGVSEDVGIVTQDLLFWLVVMLQRNALYHRLGSSQSNTGL